MMSVVYNDVQRVNNSQKHKSFEINAVTMKISMTAWISPLNIQSGWPFILPLQSMGGNEYGISGHLHNFAFEALNNAFKGIVQ